MQELNIPEFRIKLENAIVQINKEIVELKKLTAPIAPENAIGRVSRMDAINNKSINEAALIKSEEKFLKLRYALTKMDDGSFGKCDRCGQPIQPMRLEIMPESNYCVRCAAR